MLTALSGVFNPVLLVYVDWPTAPVRVHSGVGNISFDGETWSGLGKYGDIIIPGEQAGIVSEKAELVVSGTIADLLQELNKDPRNKDVEIYFGITTEPAGNTLVGTPNLLFTGYVDSIRFTLDRSGQ